MITIICFVIVLFGIGRCSNIRVPLVEAQLGMLQVAGLELHTGAACYMALSDIGTHYDFVFRITNGEVVFDIDLEESELMPLAIDAQRLDISRELVPVVGPVAFHQLPNGRTEMILNSTDENFSVSCVPGSIARCLFRPQHATGISVSSPNSVTRGDYWIDYKVYTVGGVPTEVFDSILEVLVGLGAIRQDRFMTFGEENFWNCRQAFIDHLFNIEFLFDDQTRFIITPNDYIDVDPIRNTCRLRLTHCSPLIGLRCTFNPLALEGINMRISPDATIEICDSL